MNKKRPVWRIKTYRGTEHYRVTYGQNLLK